MVTGAGKLGEVGFRVSPFAVFVVAVEGGGVVVAAALGVPVRAPLGERVSPAGRPVAAQESGPAPPLATSVAW